VSVYKLQARARPGERTTANNLLRIDFSFSEILAHGKKDHTLKGPRVVSRRGE